MNSDRIDSLLDGINDYGVRAKVREFARAPQDEQNVHLYLAVETLKDELKSVRATKTLKDRLMEFGYVGAFIAYALFDNKDNLPMGGR